MDPEIVTNYVGNWPARVMCLWCRGILFFVASWDLGLDGEASAWPRQNPKGSKYITIGYGFWNMVPDHQRYFGFPY